MPSGASPLPGSVPERTARSGPRRERLRKATNWAGIALALGATYACFGSSPAGAKAALGSFPPLLIMGVRGCVAGAVLSGWALWTGAERPGRRRVASSLLVGTLILALGSGVGTIGQQTVPSGVVGVLSATMPLLAACLAYALFRERLARRAMVGLAIGFAGIALLLRPGSALDPTGVALVIAAQVAWAFGAVLAPRLRLPADPRLTAGLELLGGGCVLLVAGAASGHFGDLRLHAVSRSSWLGLGWLVLTAAGGFTAYGFLVKRVPTSVSTTFSYVNPVVAIGLGWLLFSEPVTMRMVVATLVLIVGVFLIVSAGKPEPARHAHHPLTWAMAWAAACTSFPSRARDGSSTVFRTLVVAEGRLGRPDRTSVTSRISRGNLFGARPRTGASRCSGRLAKSGQAAANGKAALVQITATEMAAPCPLPAWLLSDAL